MRKLPLGHMPLAYSSGYVQYTMNINQVIGLQLNLRYSLVLVHFLLRHPYAVRMTISLKHGVKGINGPHILECVKQYNV